MRLHCEPARKLQIGLSTSHLATALLSMLPDHQLHRHLWKICALKQNINLQMVSDPSGGNITFQCTADSYNKQNIIKKCMCKYDESMYPERFVVAQISQ
jgi:hypothetical protein